MKKSGECSGTLSPFSDILTLIGQHGSWCHCLGRTELSCAHMLFPFSLSRNAMRQNHLLSLSGISSCLTKTVAKLTVSQWGINLSLLSSQLMQEWRWSNIKSNIYIPSRSVQPPPAMAKGRCPRALYGFSKLDTASLQKLVQSLLDLTDISGTLSIAKNR